MTIGLAAIAVAACSQGSAPADIGAVAGSATPTGVREQPVVPGKPARVFVFAGVDSACKPVPAPALTVVSAPAKGDVSFRPGQATTIAVATGATCKGAEAIGTGVYYTARAGSAGADRFAITARLASGETFSREFSVRIAE